MELVFIPLLGFLILKEHIAHAFLVALSRGREWSPSYLVSLAETLQVTSSCKSHERCKVHGSHRAEGLACPLDTSSSSGGRLVTKGPELLAWGKKEGGQGSKLVAMEMFSQQME